MEACVASLLDCNIEDVPNLCEAEKTERGYWLALEDWCKSRGWMLFNMPINDGNAGAWWPKDALCIAGGQSPRGDFDHAIVWLCGRRVDKGRMIHDPHPSCAGIVGRPKDLTFLVMATRAEGHSEWGEE